MGSPANSNGETSVLPSASFNDGHLSVKIAPGTIENFMAVAVVGCRDSIVRMAGNAVVGMGHICGSIQGWMEFKGLFLPKSLCWQWVRHEGMSYETRGTFP